MVWKYQKPNNIFCVTKYSIISFGEPVIYILLPRSITVVSFRYFTFIKKTLNFRHIFTYTYYKCSYFIIIQVTYQHSSLSSLIVIQLSIKSNLKKMSHFVLKIENERVLWKRNFCPKTPLYVNRRSKILDIIGIPK